MAGVGPPPKPRGARARRNADAQPQTLLRHEHVEAPSLPARYRGCEETARWWETWVNSPQAEHFSATDWQSLLDTLPLVFAYYDGELRYAAEIRLRVAQYGATPADRARLRMNFVQADEAERKQGSVRSETGAARQRYGDLKVVSD